MKGKTSNPWSPLNLFFPLAAFLSRGGGRGSREVDPTLPLKKGKLIILLERTGGFQTRYALVYAYEQGKKAKGKSRKTDGSFS